MRSAHIIGKNAPVFGVAVNKKGSFFVLVFGLLYLYLGQHTCIWPASILVFVFGGEVFRSRRWSSSLSYSKEGTIAKTCLLSQFKIYFFSSNFYVSGKSVISSVLDGEASNINLFLFNFRSNYNESEESFIYLLKRLY